MGDITAANASLTLAITGLFDVPQVLQGFAADDVYSLDEIENVETYMGVDGVLSGGFVYKAIEQGIMLQADSASNDLFDIWYTQQQSDKATYLAQGLIVLPAIRKKFVQTNGFLVGYKPPDGKKLLQPRRFRIRWNQVLPAPI
jgi:ribosomal protein L34